MKGWKQRELQDRLAGADWDDLRDAARGGDAAAQGELRARYARGETDKVRGIYADPFAALRYARGNMRRYRNPEWHQAYGEALQTLASPVNLPDLRGDA
jgi:hypothetical protein